ncbi:hypothetical protein DV736_g4959, partial [Chaetothyriales sp. CBS 134916]
MATEFVSFPLREGQTPHDPASRTATIIKETFDTIAQQPGFQRLYWGTETENPNILRIAIDWDSVDHHINFTKTEKYKLFIENFGQIVDISKGVLYHAHLSPHPPTRAISQPTTPATETLVAFFPSSYSKADQDKFEEDFKNILSALETHGADISTSTASGWVVEELPIPNSESNETGKAFVALIGWISVQAHLDFRNTQAFKDNIHWLRGAKDLKGVKMVHIASTLVE